MYNISVCVAILLPSPIPSVLLFALSVLSSHIVALLLCLVSEAAVSTQDSGQPWYSQDLSKTWGILGKGQKAEMVVRVEQYGRNGHG